MDASFDKKIGKNISTIRQAKELTQEQLSARLQVQGCNLTRGALAKIEVGKRHLYPDEIAALKTVLDCNYEDLFKNSDTN